MTTAAAKKSTAGKPIAIEGAAGVIKGLITPSLNRNAPVALVLGPDPRVGGTMWAPVCRALHHTLATGGMTVLSIDYASVGGSVGRWSAEGSVCDATAAIQWLLQYADTEHVVLAGYGFGSWVALQAAARHAAVRQVVAVSPVPEFFDYGFAAHSVTASTLIMHGAADEIVPEGLAKGLARQMKTAGTDIVYRRLEGDHFLANCLQTISHAVVNFLAPRLATGNAVQAPAAQVVKAQEIAVAAQAQQPVEAVEIEDTPAEVVAANAMAAVVEAAPAAMEPVVMAAELIAVALTAEAAAASLPETQSAVVALQPRRPAVTFPLPTAVPAHEALGARMVALTRRTVAPSSLAAAQESSAKRFAGWIQKPPTAMTVRLDGATQPRLPLRDIVASARPASTSAPPARLTMRSAVGLGRRPSPPLDTLLARARAAPSSPFAMVTGSRTGPPPMMTSNGNRCAPAAARWAA